MKPAPMMPILLSALRRQAGRPARALVELLHGNEQRADHRRRFRRAQDLGEPARLHPQRQIDRQLQALIDDLQDRARRRIIVVGLAAIDARWPAGTSSCRPWNRPGRPAAGNLRRPRAPSAVPPALIQSFAVCTRSGGRHHGVDQLHRLGPVELELVALEQKLQRIGRLQHAGDALGAAGAGKQADLDLGQAEPRLRVVGGDAVMAGQRQLEAAADRGAVDRRDPRLAAGLDAPIEQRQLAAFVEQPLAGGFLAFVLVRSAKLRPSVSSMVRSAPAQNGPCPR